MLLQLNNIDLCVEEISNLCCENYNELFPESVKSKIALKNNDEAKRQSIAAYLLLDRLLNGAWGLSIKDLLFNKNGKPYFENGPHISLSHSGDYACAAVSSSPIGVDIEKLREFDLKILDRFFTHREKSYILKRDTQKRFFTLWTLKEAVIKREGRTLSDLSKIRLIIFGNRIFYKNFKFKTFFHENYVISVCFDEKTGK